MATLLGTMVAGSTRTDLRLYVVDENGGVVDLTGGTSRLQGTTGDLPAKVTIDVVGTITGPSGLVTWTSAGNIITAADLAGSRIARYACRHKFTDSAAKVAYGPAFELDWVAQPI